MQHILAIPIKADMEDFLAWHYDTKGLFSVKSAYHVLENKKEREAMQQQGNSSLATESSPVSWLKLWTLSYPPKIKNLYRLGLANDT